MFMDDPDLNYRFTLSTLRNDLSQEELSAITDSALIKTFKKKAILFFEDDPIQNVYILMSGKVKLSKSSLNGRECIIDIMKPGDIFPYENIFYNNKYNIYAEFMENSIVSVIPLIKFQQIITHNWKLSVHSFIKLSEQLFDLYDRLTEKTLYSLDDQILLLLLRLCKKHGKPITDENWVVLDIYISNRDLANMIGTSRETMSRFLNVLTQKKIISYNSEHLLMINQERIKSALQKAPLH